MNAKISVFVTSAKPIIRLLLYNLHDCTFNELSDDNVVSFTKKENYSLI